MPRSLARRPAMSTSLVSRWKGNAHADAATSLGVQNSRRLTVRQRLASYSP